MAELPFVKKFIKGWFTLRFTRAEHMNWVLSSFWHIEQALILLRRWNPLFNLEREQLSIGQYGSIYQAYPFNSVLKTSFGTLDTLWAPIWSMINHTSLLA